MSKRLEYLGIKQVNKQKRREWVIVLLIFIGVTARISNWPCSHLTRFPARINCK